ncbi:MAG: hypothetical protein HPY58_12845 [Firmicutes bacterium]|nr:hypothetical protein [Bacillota bacterium]NPV30509.1 hypothetical protein [Bacillota bacterium]
MEDLRPGAACIVCTAGLLRGPTARHRCGCRVVLFANMKLFPAAASRAGLKKHHKSCPINIYAKALKSADGDAADKMDSILTKCRGTP